MPEHAQRHENSPPRILPRSPVRDLAYWSLIGLNIVGLAANVYMLARLLSAVEQLVSVLALKMR